MSANSVSEISHDNDYSSSAYDMGLGDSDIEISSSGTETDSTVPKDYWFGRKFFECVMAQNLIHDTSPDESMATIDSKLEAITRAFPYEQSLKKLEAQELSKFFPDTDTELQDAYQIMVICIGAIIRSGTREQKHVLLATLRDEAKIPPSAASRDTWKSSLPQRSASDRSMSAQDLGQFAMTLQQYGTMHDFVPHYVVHTLSTSPSRFKAVVSFQGSSFDGTGRNKRGARHEAARKACDFLAIRA